MPTNVQALNQTKDRILSTIKIRGPSLPVHIAKSIGVSPLFASAFLSELIAEKKLKTSNMKVGSSPLYLLPGQETHLENFSEHLNNREQEALTKLKESQILEDEKQEPVIRVALRAIKDFAVPLKIRIDGESKLFWKHFSLQDDQVKNLLENSLPTRPTDENDPPPSNITKPQEISDPSNKEIEPKEEPPQPRKPQALDKPSEEVSSPQQVSELKKESNKSESSSEKHNPKPQKPKPKTIESKFGEQIKDYLLGKDIELLKIDSEKKKELLGHIRIDTLLGKQSFHLTAKDKKSITDTDLLLASQKAQTEKLPALLISPGNLNKKAKEYLKDWGNLVKFEQIKL